MVKRIKKEPTSVISVRMTKSEIALLRHAAERMSLTPSEYMRYLATKRKIANDQRRKLSTKKVS